MADGKMESEWHDRMCERSGGLRRAARDWLRAAGRRSAAAVRRRQVQTEHVTRAARIAHAGNERSDAGQTWHRHDAEQACGTAWWQTSRRDRRWGRRCTDDGHAESRGAAADDEEWAAGRRGPRTKTETQTLRTSRQHDASITQRTRYGQHNAEKAQRQQDQGRDSVARRRCC